MIFHGNKPFSDQEEIFFARILTILLNDMCTNILTTNKNTVLESKRKKKRHNEINVLIL